MLHPRASLLGLLGLAASLAAGAFVACSETGPDADPRSNGCIGEGCFNGGYSGDGRGPGDGAAVPDGPPAITNPLQGIAPVATLVQGGFQFAEGPVWIGDRLIFSDVDGNAMHQLLADGGVGFFRQNSGGANGNAVDPQGRLVTCEGANRRLVRTNAQLQNRQSIADVFGGKQFNATNDVIVRADGNVYFTDPSYAAVDAGQDKEAVYRLAPSAGPDAAERIDFTFNKPNGIALSPDGDTLYVMDNGDGRLMGAQLDPGGAVIGIFTKVADAEGGDGMAVDDLGNLYIAAKAGVVVLDTTGASIGLITLPTGTPSNCAFGGADRRTLFITANNGQGDPATGLYRIRLNVPGLP
jgi:gluconolactonase